MFRKTKDKDSFSQEKEMDVKPECNQQIYHITEQFDKNVWDEMVRAVLPIQSYFGWYQELKEHVSSDYMWKQYFNKIGNKNVYFNKSKQQDATPDEKDLFDVLHRLHRKLELAKRKRLNSYRKGEIDYMKSIPNFGISAKDEFYRFSFLMAYKKEYGEEALWKMIMPDYKPFNFMDWIEND